MSWYGEHPRCKLEEVAQFIGPAACRRCRYKIRLQYDGDYFGDYLCSRCGLWFPGTEIALAKKVDKEILTYLRNNKRFVWVEGELPPNCSESIARLVKAGKIAYHPLDRSKVAICDKD